MMDLFMKLLLVLFVSSTVAGNHTCSQDELPCDSGDCISVGMWCDSTVDCEDGSDENYCANPTRPQPACKEHHFNCSDGSCIPLAGLCNGYPDCPDKSDEECGSETAGYVSPTVLEADYLEAAKKALDWLMGQRSHRDCWGKDTPRAVVAYALASKVFGNEDMRAMKKQLNIQIAMELLKASESNKPMPMGDLALSINGLLATCQNPKNFEDTNLVKMLRDEVKTRTADESNRASPFVYLTLCLAGETNDMDFSDVYHSALEARHPDMLAMCVIALNCMASRIRFRGRIESAYQTLTYALQDYAAGKYSLDIYTSSLMAQAVNSATNLPALKQRFQENLPREFLLSNQLPDGSFGDILSTYYAIPALLKLSLLDVDSLCSTENGRVTLATPEKPLVVHYSLWMATDSETEVHSRELVVGKNSTFLDVMELASTKSPVFDFEVQNDEDGMTVYSIAGIPNDSEKGTRWRLYVNELTSQDDLAFLAKRTTHTEGVDKLAVKNGDNFVFVYI